ncbi:NTP transferase domain-containing protein [Sphingobacterium sp. N143]|uniref:NTP transferase domain-containing protein n=1 Tax=Sphingobacterium sp. N143 TaxID=2746727 RepID=UPI00257845C8|nr:NTP transferase domain-containing protein [Sphingobacterium sp. N143]MDM1295667.1 NTP transferase domain-containing protein [Sphingobacterium sp. N143]
MVPSANKYPKLNGLILIGGRSKRMMGFPKERIEWHGKQQRYYLCDLLAPYCTDVYISCREDQCIDLAPGYDSLPDMYPNTGPLGGIITALTFQPERAWLVLACDLPLLCKTTLDLLIQQRTPKLIATAFKSPIDGLPEPLFAIWEPHSYPFILEQMTQQGQKSPRQILLTHQIHLLDPPDRDSLVNVNTPTDADRAKTLLLTRNQGR